MDLLKSCFVPILQLYLIVALDQNAHAEAIVGIAQAKSATLQKLSLKGCGFGDHIIASMIAALPAVELEHIPQNVGPSVQNAAIPSNNALLFIGGSRVKSLDYSKFPLILPLQMGMTLPNFLVQLDLSDSVIHGPDALVHAFGSLNYPVALSSLNVARSSLRDVPGIK